MIKLSNIVKTAAVAGLIGFGLAGTLSTPASARTFTRCDSFGCHRVTCNDGYCYRSGSGRPYYSSSYYYAPAPYYGAAYYSPRSYAYRSVKVCDRWGCHWVRRYEPRTNVSVGVNF